VVDVTAIAADHTYQGTALTRIEDSSLAAAVTGIGIRILSAIKSLLDDWKYGVRTWEP
jgi:hypothetical protein